MNILYIYAHPNSHSFNAELKNIALKTLNENGHQIILSDLYSMHFNPVASWDDFNIETNQSQYFLAQQTAYQHRELSDDIKNEIEKIKQADHLIFQFPLWWFSVPAIMKGWLDRVLVKGFAYDAGKVFQDGLLKGKTASFVLTTQSPETAYQKDGLHGETIDAFLHPIQHTLRFVGIKVHSPFVAYAAFNLDDKQKEIIFHRLADHMRGIS